MDLINLARLLAILRREGIHPNEVFVYWGGLDVGFRRPRPRLQYTEPEMGPEDDEYQDDDEGEA